MKDNSKENFYESLKKDAYFNEIINMEIKEPLEECKRLEYEILKEKKENGNRRDELMLLRFYQRAIVRFYKISDETLALARKEAKLTYQNIYEKMKENTKSK